MTVAWLVAAAAPATKSNGGVRPIALGETLGRLAAKCVQQATLPAVSTSRPPYHVGVKVPNAADLVACKVKAW